MQAFLVLPGFGLAYLWAGPARLRRRLWQLLAGLGGVIVGRRLVDRDRGADARRGPALLRRVDQQQHPPARPRLQRARPARRVGDRVDRRRGRRGRQRASAGRPGVFRLFQSEFGGQVSWLIPAALLSLAALLWVSRRARAHVPRPRLRPAVGRLAAGDRPGLQLHAGDHPPVLHGGARAGDRRARRRRRHLAAAVGHAARGPGRRGGRDARHRGLGVRAARPDAGVAALAAVDRPARRAARRGGRVRRARPYPRCARAGAAAARSAAMLAYAPLALALVAGLGGPLAYSLDTANTTHTGSIPSAGPTVAGSFGGPGGGGPGGNSAAPAPERAAGSPARERAQAPEPARARQARATPPAAFPAEAPAGPALRQAAPADSPAGPGPAPRPGPGPAAPAPEPARAPGPAPRRPALDPTARWERAAWAACRAAPRSAAR